MATEINIPKLLQIMFEDYKGAKTEGTSILQQVAEMFGPGYLKGEETKMLAGMEQGMVGRGLGGTTRPAAVGMGIKADIRDRRTKAKTGAMTNIANFMAAMSPTPGTLAHLATGGFSGMLDQQRLALQAAGQSGGLGPMASQGLSVFGRPLNQSIAPTGGGGGGTTAGGGWTPGGLPSNTGAGAATYGISGGISSGGGGGSSGTPWPTMAPLGGAFYGSQEAFEASLEPETGSVPMGRRTGPTIKEPTISEYLQQHGLDPTSNDPALMGQARTLQQQWASKYM